MSADFSDRVDLVPVTYSPKREQGFARAVAIIDGLTYSLKAYTVSANAHGATDTATITLPITGNPDWTVQLFRGDFSSLGGSGSDNSPVYVEIRAGFAQNPNISPQQIAQFSRQFLGIVDVYSAELHDDAITFRCRSLAAPLVDTKITTISLNQTTEQFVTQQATALGLQTSFKLGQAPATIQEVLGYDNIGGSKFNAAVYGLRAWDLILRCAQVDDVDVWVDVNGVLHYEAPSLVTRNTVTLQWGRDWEALTVTHSPQFSRNIQVEVRTYQRRTKTSTTARTTTDLFGGVTTSVSTKTLSSESIPGTNEVLTTAVGANGVTTTTLTSYGSGGSFSGSGGVGAKESGKERYIFYVKNVSPQRANAMAQAFWRQISMHEFRIDGKLPMTKELLALGVTSLIRLIGTPFEMVNGTRGVFWPRQLDQSFSLVDGWKIDVSAVNHELPQGAV